MESIALHLMDIIDNSISAHATRIIIEIIIDEHYNFIEITISDNGRGIPEKDLKKVLDPFYSTRKTRKIGLGLSLLKQNVEQTGGYLHIESIENEGTQTQFRFNLKHIDCPPMGNIQSILSTLFTIYPKINFELIVKNSKQIFSFESQRFYEIFKGVPLTQVETRNYFYEFINSNLTFLNEYNHITHNNTGGI